MCKNEVVELPGSDCSKAVAIVFYKTDNGKAGVLPPSNDEVETILIGNFFVFLQNNGLP